MSTSAGTGADVAAAEGLLDGIVAGLGGEGERQVLLVLAAAMIFLAFISFHALTSGISAPYGRFSRAGWGFMVNGTVAWVIQEAPNLVVGALCYLYRDDTVWANPANQALFVLFCVHYAHRTLIFPFRLKGKPTPVTVMMMATLFCLVNGYIQLRYLTKFANAYPDDYISSPRFLFGVVVFFVGMGINIASDNTLIGLRANSTERGQYKIPYGGMFTYVSGANFFGEIVEWTGFAIAGSSLPAVSFAMFTFCNIAPRGAQHHEWYRRTFPNYPRQRKAVIPFLW